MSFLVKLLKIDVSRVFALIVEVLTLLSPVILLFFGIDITGGIDKLADIGLILGALVIAVKDLIQIVKGWFDAGRPSLLSYLGMTQADYYQAVDEYLLSKSE